MPHAVRMLLVSAIAALAIVAHAQTYFDIELDSVRSGVIPTEEIDHVYVLDVPDGIAGFRVLVQAGGDDADLAVYYGSEATELFYDISSDPNPSFAIDAPRPGRYEIHVMNLLWKPLHYELTVRSTQGHEVAPRPGSGAAAVGPGSAAPSVSIGVAAVAPGEPMRVNFAGAPGYARDWVGLFREGATDQAYVTWAYTEGQRAGQLAFDAPDEPGHYEFRLLENDGYTRLATSRPFEVRAPSTPRAPVANLPCDQLANGAPLAEMAIGSSASVACPANCSPSGRLWGTDVYTDDSQVCLAARHAGVIGPEGGAFTVTITAGEGRYTASTRNGVTANSWGRWGRSFTVAPADGTAVVVRDTSAAVPLAGAWRVNANGHRGTLTFEWDGAAWRAVLDIGRAEQLDGVSFDGRTVRFTRLLGTLTQEYVGELERDGATLRFSGTFYQGAARTPYPWAAER
jgi:hypothetical protein